MQIYDTDTHKLIYKNVSVKNKVIELLEKYCEDNEITKTLRVYAHNMQFDFKFLTEYALKNYIVKPIGDPIKEILLQKKKINGKVKAIFDFRDSIALLPMSLKEIGEIIGEYKLDFEDYDGPITPEYIKYCEQDCVVVFEALKYFQKMFANFKLHFALHKLPLTLPAASYKLFHLKNDKYKKKKKYNILTDIPVQQNVYFRKWYYGGRTEVYDFNLYVIAAYLDFNSLYPSILMFNDFPVPPYTRNRLFGSINYCLENKNDKIFALLCRVNDKQYYPLIPEREDGKNIYRSKLKEALLTKQEYDVLKKDDRIIEVLEVWICDKFERLFEYMNEIYDKRIELKSVGNTMETLYKLPMNSTYGKFAEKTVQREEQFINYSEMSTEILDEIEKEGFEYRLYDEREVVRIWKDVDREIRINVVFAWLTTSLARFKLWQYLNIFHDLGVNPIYSDTDSIVVNPKLLTEDVKKKFLSETKLGMLKAEFTAKNFQAFSVKEYAYFSYNLPKDKKKKKKQKIITKDTVCDVLKQKCKGIDKDTSIFDYYKDGMIKAVPTKLKECFIRKLDFDSCINRVKTKQTYYDKRLILDDLSTIPLDENQIIEEIHDKNQQKIIKISSQFENLYYSTLLPKIE